MAVRLYDEALFNKIKKWVKDPHMQILKPDETMRLFEIEADTKGDKALTLPIIALSRNKDIEILCTKKQPRTFNGWPLKDSTKDPLKASTTLLNVIPMKIGYQIDIYTKGMEEADEYVRNFVFNLVNYPKLVVDLPYKDLNIQHASNLYLEESITDNSDIKEHLFADQFIRFTLKLYIDDAYLFSLPEIESATWSDNIGLQLDVEDRISGKVVESHTDILPEN